MKKIWALAFAIIIFLPTNIFAFQFIDNLNRAGEIGVEVDTLKKEQEELKKKLTELSAKVEFYQSFNEILLKDMIYLSKIFPKTAAFSPSSKGYSVLACPNGYFAVSCKNIKSYSTGSELTIQLVNMLSIATTDIEINIAYATSEKFDNEGKILEGYKTSRVEHTEKVSGEFLPATAKQITIRAPEYKPEQIKLVELTVIAGGIKYRMEK